MLGQGYGTQTDSMDTGTRTQDTDKTAWRQGCGTKHKYWDRDVGQTRGQHGHWDRHREMGHSEGTSTRTGRDTDKEDSTDTGTGMQDRQHRMVLGQGRRTQTRRRHGHWDRHRDTA